MLIIHAKHSPLLILDNIGQHLGGHVQRGSALEENLLHFS